MLSDSFSFLSLRNPSFVGVLRSTTTNTAPDANPEIDDDWLLKTVKREQLVELCQQFQLSTQNATKKVLLQRLRKHAARQVSAAKRNLANREERLDQGFGDSEKERYQMAEEDDVPFGVRNEEEPEVFFFFEDPHFAPNVSMEEPHPTSSPPMTSAELTGPPLPTDPDENGERVVKIYSTSDENDMTAIASAQPGSGVLSSASGLASTAGASRPPQPWDAPQRKSEDEKLHDQAKERVSELVATLLANTGTPGFVEDVSLPTNFVAFDPSSVSPDFLSSYSRDLLMGRGKVLRSVMDEFEVRAVGHDGVAGDNKSRGGGHYAQVSKIRAFLEGYRRARVQSQARETATMLLDKLVQEGVQGLDMTLATMVKSSDDTGIGGELNDSLIEFLNDMIRTQKKKVEKSKVVRSPIGGSPLEEETDVDPFATLWNVTMEDGKRIETLDPNDPNVKRVVDEEIARVGDATIEQPPLPEAVSEKLLLLLQSLRERIQVEASFPMDEKTRNLRLLAYCLRVSSDQDREQLISDHLGRSLDVRVLLFLFPSCLTRVFLFSRALIPTLSWFRALSNTLKVCRTRSTRPRSTLSI